MEIKTVLEEESTAVTELNYTAVFVVKHLFYFPNDLGSDFVSSTLKQHFVLHLTVCQWTVAYGYS